MYKNTIIIAEVKTESPFGFKSEKNWRSLFDTANNIGDIIAIHTDKKWGGSFDHIKKARSLTDKYILAKGIHKQDYQIKMAIESGADAVLVVGRIPEIYLGRCFIEPLHLRLLNFIPKDTRVVWNSRDLENGKPKTETFEQARDIWKGWLCQASYIKSVEDIKPGADAILVGSYLEEFAKSLSI